MGWSGGFPSGDEPASTVTCDVHFRDRLFSNDRFPLKWALAVLLLALGLRLGAACWWESRRPADAPFAFGDSVSYWHLARRIARGEPYAYPDERARIFRTPLYPLVLSPLFLVWGDHPPVLAARLIGVALGVWAVWEIMRLGRSLAGWRAGLGAGVLAACYPGAVAMSVFVLAESLFSPLMAAGLVWLVLAYERVKRRKNSAMVAVAAGLLSGLASLARPSWLLFLPFALVFLLLDRRCRLWDRGRLAAWALLGLAVAMTPWWYRSYRLTGHFVLTTLQVGASLYDGLHEGATGASDMTFTRSFDRRFAADWQADQGEDYEYALDRAYRRAAWRWARDNPARAGALVWAKLRRMWLPWPSAQMFSGGMVRLAVAGTFLPILTLGAIGWWLRRRDGWPIWLLAFPAIYFTILHVIFVSSIRYRQPAMLVWCVPAGWCLLWMWQRWCSRGSD